MNIKNYLVDNYDFKFLDNNLWGKMNSYGVVLSKLKSSIFIKVSFNNNEPGEELKILFDEYLEKNTITSFKRNKIGVDIHINNEIIDDNKIIKLLESLVKKLRSINLVNTCNSCNSDNETSFIKYNNEVENYCENCISKIENEINSELNIPNNYFRGTVGALLGAVIGSFCWIIIGYYGYFASFAGIPIALAAIKGYELFGGKQTNNKASIVIFAILVGVLFGEYVGLMLAAMKFDSAWTITSWIEQTPYLLNETDLLKQMLLNIGVGILFAGLGSHTIIRDIFYADKVIKKLDRLS